MKTVTVFEVGDWVMRKDGGICKPHNVYRVQIQDPRWANEDSEYLILCPPEPTPEQIPGLRVKDFRPPRDGDTYRDSKYTGIGIWPVVGQGDHPRYILEKIEEPKPEPASRWIECEVEYRPLSGGWFHLEKNEWQLSCRDGIHGFAGMQYENDPNWYMSPKVFDEGGSRDECDDGCHTRRIRKVRFEKSAVEGK